MMKVYNVLFNYNNRGYEAEVIAKSSAEAIKMLQANHKYFVDVDWIQYIAETNKAPQEVCCKCYVDYEEERIDELEASIIFHFMNIYNQDVDKTYDTYNKLYDSIKGSRAEKVEAIFLKIS